MIGLKSAKKNLNKKENAVSEVMGVALLLGIVVIMLSFEGAFIFSRSGPDDLPHAKLQEWMDTSEEKIYLKHFSGEPIKIEELKIIANINGNSSYVYNSSKAYAETGNNGYWELGEMITLNASSEWGLNLKDTDEIDLYIVDTPTKELIQKSRLTTDFRKRSYETDWITPRGNVYDTSPGGHATRGQVQKPEKSDDPTTHTVFKTPTKNVTDSSYDYSNIYEVFEFGINPCMYGFRPGDSLTNVTLRIVFRTNDNSLLRVKLVFYGMDGSSEKTFNESKLPEKNAFTTWDIDLIPYINTTEDLANFTVKLEAVTNANENSGKEINIDYLGLWIQ